VSLSLGWELRCAWPSRLATITYWISTLYLGTDRHHPEEHADIIRHTVQTQGRNIQTYAEYLLQRAIEYGATKVDYVRGGEGRLKRLNIEKGLLREAESVQSQIRYLLKCEVCRSPIFHTRILILISHDQPFHDDPENEITLTAFRLLTMDLLVLFHVMNEGTINVLGMFSWWHLLMTILTSTRTLLRAVKTRCYACAWHISDVRETDRVGRSVSQYRSAT
jgi:hypothetical protein